MINDFLCNSINSILEAMRIINNNASGTCFVVDKDNKLIGVATDGDIRRALLNGSKLDENIKNIISTEFIYGRENDNKEDLISKITHRVSIIPIVNNDFKVVDYFEYKQNSYFPVAIPNLDGNELKYLTDAFISTWISSSGEYIEKFEKKFSKYSDCNYGVTTSNGTTALHLALLSLGIGKNDEVIVPDLTFAATINSVIHANATPVIVDVDKDSWCIDPVEIEKSITSKTKAIIVVHIYGQVCDMDKIIKISKKYNLKIIEDCAEAHGATFKERKVGSFGDIGCFSFYGNKIITTGEGGMCVTNNKDMYEKMKILRDHGMSKNRRYWHVEIGYNYRMTNLQAAIGLAQLERIDMIHKNRKEYEISYKNILPEEMFTFQKDYKNRKRVVWLVSALINSNFNREEYICKLKEKGVDIRPFFYPLSDMDIYKDYSKGETPVAHRLSRTGINFPTYENLKNKKEIIDILRSEM